MTLKHTPGPWQAISQGLTHLVSQGCDDDFRFAIAKVWEQTYHPDGPRAAHIEAVANVRLIAAAPDLLAALQYVTDILSSSVAPDDYEPFRKCVSQARAAISKATGE